MKSGVKEDKDLRILWRSVSERQASRPLSLGADPSVNFSKAASFRRQEDETQNDETYADHGPLVAGELA
ncbi:MAG: hypothetical protein WA996_17100 [Candidatus Promineifilaceae bacterium]